MPRSGVAFVLSGDVFRRRYAAVLVGGGKYLWQRRLRAPCHRLCSNMRYAHNAGGYIAPILGDAARFNMRYAHNAGEYIAPMDGAMPRGPNMRYAHSMGGYIAPTLGGCRVVTICAMRIARADTLRRRMGGCRGAARDFSLWRGARSRRCHRSTIPFFVNMPRSGVAKP